MDEREEDREELKKKLVRRIGIAGVAIIVLLGGLTLLEKVVKEAAGPAQTPAVTASAVQTEPQAQTAETPAEPVQARPEDAPPATQEEPRVEPRAEPEETETPLAPPPKEATPSQRIVIKPPPPAAVPKKVPAMKSAPVGKATTTPAPAEVPPAAKPDGAAAMAPIARSYRLQMGVFTSAAHAGELQAKLEKAGIPSYLETRVQVGPFKTQKEADTAREKLKALGLGPGMLIPPQRR